MIPLKQAMKMAELMTSYQPFTNAGYNFSGEHFFKVTPLIDGNIVLGYEGGDSRYVTIHQDGTFTDTGENENG